MIMSLQVESTKSWQRLVHDADDETLDEEKCGCELRCGCFRTKRRTVEQCTFFNNPRGALFVLSLTAFVQGAVISGLYNINVSTLEKRFGLRSSETGFISSSYDIAGCIAIPIISYIGGAGHKPMWIASGTLIQGVGSIIFSLPHFISTPYSIAEVKAFDCQTLENCDETSLRAFRGFFIVGQMLLGIGATPLYILALSYIDENVEQNQSSIYQGIFYASSFLGPGIGFILGGQLLTHFTTFVDPDGISPDSPLWVGNWWLGFVIAGIIFIIISIPLFMFPIRMPKTENVRINRENEIHQHVDALRVQGNKEFGKSIKDAPQSFLIFVRNKTMVLFSIGNAFEVGMMASLATFGPKYVESIFSISSSDAAFYFGVISITSACSANLISGALISKLQLNVTQMLRMSVTCGIIAFSFLFVFLISCENSDIAGVTVPYVGMYDIQCTTSECGCSTELYRPVCGTDNLTYISFCDAGCNIVDSMNFQNCTKMSNISSNLEIFSAKAGVCPHKSCSNLALFLVFVGFSVFLSFMASQPNIQTTLRIVPFSQRSFTLGMQWLIVRIIGNIPMPIVYGRVLDSSCILWGKQCGECSSCHVYNNSTMAISMTWLNLVLKGIHISFLIAVYFTYKPPKAETTNLDSSTSTTTTVINATNSL